MEIVSVTRFDDFDHDLGYAYHGINYVIRNEVGEFLVRTYDDEPSVATIVRATGTSASRNVLMLVEFLRGELGVSSVSQLS